MNSGKIKLISLFFGLSVFALIGWQYTSLFNGFKAGAAFTVNNDSICASATATSTLGYMTPGTGTTTASCFTGNDSGPSSAVIQVVMNASSTASIYNLYVEESMDNQDWFPVGPNQSASTTNPFISNVVAYSRFQFASSTIGAKASGSSLNQLGVDNTNNRNHFSVDVPTRMRYIRAFVGLDYSAGSVTASHKNGAVWLKILPKVEL